jgi:hypothetical protein
MSGSSALSLGATGRSGRSSEGDHAEIADPENDEAPNTEGPIRENHRFGDELVWWERRAIDPVATARMLWISTRRIE